MSFCPYQLRLDFSTPSASARHCRINSSSLCGVAIPRLDFFWKLCSTYTADANCAVYTVRKLQRCRGGVRFATLCSVKRMTHVGPDLLRKTLQVPPGGTHPHDGLDRIAVGYTIIRIIVFSVQWREDRPRPATRSTEDDDGIVKAPRTTRRKDPRHRTTDQYAGSAVPFQVSALCWSPTTSDGGAPCPCRPAASTGSCSRSVPTCSAPAPSPVRRRPAARGGTRRSRAVPDRIRRTARCGAR